MSKKENVIFIGNMATDCPLSKIKKFMSLIDLDAVRGIVKLDGKNYRWSTIQQYKYHNGFNRR